MSHDTDKSFAESGAAQQAQEVAPNVALREGAAPVTVNGVANIGLDITVSLPGEAEQRAGWYDPHARDLARQYPNVYYFGRPTAANEAQKVADLYMSGFLDAEQAANLLAVNLIGAPKRKRVRASLPLYRYPHFFGPHGICDGPRPWQEQDDD